MKNRDDEIEEARINYIENEAVCDDVCEECAASNGFRKGAAWSDKHPSVELIERIITMAFDGWDFISGFDELAKSIRKELDNSVNSSIM